jgi:hypothetical protein
VFVTDSEKINGENKTTRRPHIKLDLSMAGDGSPAHQQDADH